MAVAMAMAPRAAVAAAGGSIIVILAARRVGLAAAIIAGVGASLGCGENRPGMT